MELFLNLAWMLLALPAYWLWRGARGGANRSFTSLQCLLALACVLVMLFPVVSATDDLRAMRTEMEESPASKRSLRQAAGEKTSLWNSQPHTPPAIVPALVSFAFGSEYCEVPPSPTRHFSGAYALLHDGRAPPGSQLAVFVR